MLGLEKKPTTGGPWWAFGLFFGFSELISMKQGHILRRFILLLCVYIGLCVSDIAPIKARKIRVRLLYFGQLTFVNTAENLRFVALFHS
jgi:hypothetical protein